MIKNKMNTLYKCDKNPIKYISTSINITNKFVYEGLTLHILNIFIISEDIVIIFFKSSMGIITQL